MCIIKRNGDLHFHAKKRRLRRQNLCHSGLAAAGVTAWKCWHNCISRSVKEKVPGLKRRLLRMKKRILCLLLLMCMLLSLVLVSASAEEESGAGAEPESHIDLDQAQIYVGVDRVSNVRLSGDGWRFDKETDTLILNNFSIGGTSYSYLMGEKWEDIYEIAYIHVGGTDVNLKIRSEGNEENWIGGYECMGKPSTIVYNKWGYGEQYFSYGIYNPYGTVEITGSTPLNIYTHSIGIYAKHITMHGANVTVNTYACPIYAWDRKASVFNVTGNSVVNIHAYSSQEAYTPYSGIAPDFAVYAYELNVSEGSQLCAEIERIDTPITDRVQALYLQKLNVNGGKVSAICRDDGKNGTREERINSAAKVMDAIVVSGGGEVEGYIYNPTPFRSGSFAFSGRIKKYFAGSGVIRGGVKVTDGSGDLLGLTDFEYPEHARVTYSDMNNRPDGFAVYQEVTVTAADGVILRDGKKYLEWSYYSDFQNNDGITKPDGTQASIDLSGKELRKVIANSSNLPITIQSGKFYLNTASDDGEALTPGTIEIKKGAELVVFGEGKINDLNVIGEGKITFLGSTVAGKVDKAVTMAVDGGNINVDYEGTVTTSGGKEVSCFEYTLTSDETAFEQATYVTLLDGQNYGSAGLYPFDGKKLYLWVTKNSDIRHVNAIQSKDKNGYTLYPTSSNACLLEKTEVADISKRSYYVAVPGQNSQIIPFEKGTDHAERYDLSWSFSDDGYTWYGIYDQKAIGANGELNLTDVYSAWCNRMYRCEIRSKEDGNHTLLGVYTGLLYIYDPEFRCEGGFVDGKEVTVRFTPTKQPGVSSCSIFGISWEVSKKGGGIKTFEKIDGVAGKDSYTFTVSDEMDGWVLRCSAIAGSLSDYVVVDNKTYTIHVTEKKVRIEEQPENEQMIDRDSDENASVSVKARHATHYQWQVSKRPYVNSVGYDFEDIPGATDSTYSFPMNSVTKENWNYVYRCVVSNEYSEVISDEVYFQTKQDPDIMGFDAKTTVSEGEEASIDVIINQGNPSVANTTFWEVSTDGGVTYKNLRDVMSGDEYTAWGVEFSYSGGIKFTTSSSLRIYKVTAAMDGWIIRYTLNANGETMQKTAKLTVHQHEWSDKLTYDGENHWYPCTTPNCGAKKDEAAHSYGEGCDPYCTVCGRERAVTHDFRLMTSEAEHWYQCADCELESDRQAHSYDNDCDADCNFCKRTRVVSHNYEWQHDAEKHWQLCSKCGDKKNEETHNFTAENTDSKYLKSAVSCTEKAVFYKSCDSCGLSSHGTAHEAVFTHDDVLGHDFGAWISNGNGTHTRTCKRDASHSETDNCSGGTATCKDKATCKVCGESYGELNANNHSNLKHIDAKAATKTAEGNIEYWYCEDCGKYFADKDGINEITKADTVTAKLPEEEPIPPATGETSSYALLTALLFIGAGAVTAVVSRKRKHGR